MAPTAPSVSSMELRLMLLLTVMVLFSSYHLATASSVVGTEQNAQLSSLISKMDSGCNRDDTTVRLIPCLPASRKNPAPPSNECCDLIHVLSADCLCSCVQSPLAKVEGVDFMTALQLPRKCKRFVPPGTKCAGVTVPGWVP